MQGAGLMAKKKPLKAQRMSTVAMRCNAEFKAWLESFAEHERLTPSQLLELGLVEMAKLRKYKEPPKR